MIFKSIRLKNFRQYKSEITFDFANPKNDNNNITLFIAANGVGKTTLLQAFRYCFYGSSSNYLNLPKADDLVNNTLADDLKELEEDLMYVEVKFEHEELSYIARRERGFTKSKGILKPTNDETFNLILLEDDTKGYKTLPEDKSYERIRMILPEGLSQVFMFDGERMERNISDKEFSNDLKESILGILDIKKYDKLIEILGYPGKSRSVLGMLTSKKKAESYEDKETKDNYVKYLEQKQDLDNKIEKCHEKVDEIERKILINKDHQIKIEENRKDVRSRDKLEEDNSNKQKKLDDLAEEYIKESKYALVYKLLLLNKKKYEDFLNKRSENHDFYSYLHINTIQDVIDKEMCICGREVHHGSNEEKHLNELKKRALPIESAQHLNLIDLKFKQTAEFKKIMDKLNQIRSEMRKTKKEIQDNKDRILRINQQLLKSEDRLGSTDQIEIETLMDQKASEFKKIGEYTSTLELVKKAIKKLQKKIDIIDDHSEYNQRVNVVINKIENMKNKLKLDKENKDIIAREILSKNFNQALNNVIHGDYEVEITDKYHITIRDNLTNKDVTAALSTGQNVIISLSFMTALINTAKELSEQINNEEKYGVIMDAALSNLDEIHIDKLCRHNINNLDQLIFLSFKRQLRDEMYLGIKDHIGKAYVLTKGSNGEIVKNDIELNTLDEYIHTMEED
jgi:DNA sulfur modification protein DndD